jgi:hypothetical protein
MTSAQQPNTVAQNLSAEVGDGSFIFLGGKVCHGDEWLERNILILNRLLLGALWELGGGGAARWQSQVGLVLKQFALDGGVGAEGIDGGAFQVEQFRRGVEGVELVAEKGLVLVG